jgi:hypothetical protein
MNVTATREAWLRTAIDYLRPAFQEIGMPLPKQIYISVGFGFGSRAESKEIGGQAWARRASADGVNHVFISPAIADPAEVLGTLVHELIHVADDCQSGHKGEFARAAKELGLEGPMTATVPGAELAESMGQLAAAIGTYPHAALSTDGAAILEGEDEEDGEEAGEAGGKLHSGPSKQGTRMLKVVCPSCGFNFRTTQKWIDKGLPTCQDGTLFIVAD